MCAGDKRRVHHLPFHPATKPPSGTALSQEMMSAGTLSNQRIARTAARGSVDAGRL